MGMPDKPQEKAETVFEVSAYTPRWGVVPCTVKHAEEIEGFGMLYLVTEPVDPHFPDAPNPEFPVIVTNDGTRFTIDH